VRLGFGPGTAAETIRAGLDQIDRFVADFKAGKIAADPAVTSRRSA